MERCDTQPDPYCGYVPQKYSLFPDKTVLDNITVRSRCELRRTSLAAESGDGESECEHFARTGFATCITSD